MIDPKWLTKEVLKLSDALKQRDSQIEHLECEGKRKDNVIEELKRDKFNRQAHCERHCPQPPPDDD